MKTEIIRCDQCGKEQYLYGEWNDSYHFLDVARRQSMTVSYEKYHWHFCTDYCLTEFFKPKEEQT